MVWENGPTSYIMLSIEKTAIQDSNQSAISFRDRHFLIYFMLLFHPIWQKGQENHITKQLRHESQTNPHGIRIL